MTTTVPVQPAVDTRIKRELQRVHPAIDVATVQVVGINACDHDWNRVYVVLYEGKVLTFALADGATIKLAWLILVDHTNYSLEDVNPETGAIIWKD